MSSSFCDSLENKITIGLTQTLMNTANLNSDKAESFLIVLYTKFNSNNNLFSVVVLFINTSILNLSFVIILFHNLFSVIILLFVQTP